MPSRFSPAQFPSLYALASGALYALCFPPVHFTLLAWVALVPLLAVCLQRRARWRMFFYGFGVGLVLMGVSCSWIYETLRTYGRLDAGWAALSFMLFIAAFALPFGLFTLAMGEVAARWQMAALGAAPFLWVAMEWLRTYVPFDGLPFNLLGYGVAPHTGWVQPAAYAGIYGVSFLVAAVNALVAACWVAPTRRRWTALGAAALALAVSWAWGRALPPAETSATVVLVQTNLPQQEVFDPYWVQRHPEEIAALEELTRAAARAEPGLVVWPEVPVSFYFHHDPVTRARLTGLAQATRSYFLVGIVDYKLGADEKLHPYNSAALVGPEGGFVGQYDKIHLVPFGEYLPMPSLFKPLGRLVAEVSDFRAGREQKVLPVPRLGSGPGAEASLAVFICYEGIFPGLVRGFVERGGSVLVNISNDGWFGRSSAAAQQLNVQRVRAVETRRWLLRGTNTGLTAVVDPYGRITAQAEPHTRSTLTAGFAPVRTETFYVRFGDWLAALCTLVSAALVARKLWMTAVERD